MSETTVRIEGVSLVEFYGANNAKFDVLKRSFPKLKLIPRGSKVKVIGSKEDIEVFEKGGQKLLDLSPKEALDSTSVISSVRIYDKRYRTEKNISALSTFKDLKAAYKISKIDNLINSVVVSENEINASFTIDKSELPGGLRFDMDATIDAIQIPEKAKIKFFMLHW